MCIQVPDTHPHPNKKVKPLLEYLYTVTIWAAYLPENISCDELTVGCIDKNDLKSIN